jgi:hypothetical protein
MAKQNEGTDKRLPQVNTAQDQPRHPPFASPCRPDEQAEHDTSSGRTDYRLWSLESLIALLFVISITHLFKVCLLRFYQSIILSLGNLASE